MDALDERLTLTVVADLVERSESHFPHAGIWMPPSDLAKGPRWVTDQAMETRMTATSYVTELEFRTFPDPEALLAEFLAGDMRRRDRAWLPGYIEDLRALGEEETAREAERCLREIEGTDSHTRSNPSAGPRSD